MIPHTLVLRPGLVIHSIYNGYWFWGRPSIVRSLARPAVRLEQGATRLGSERAGTARALGRGRPRPLPRMEQTRGPETASQIEVQGARVP